MSGEKLNKKNIARETRPHATEPVLRLALRFIAGLVSRVLTQTVSNAFLTVEIAHYSMQLICKFLLHTPTIFQ